MSNFKIELDSGDASPFAQYLPQNWQRNSRLDRKFKLSNELQSTVAKLEKPINWLLITEHWCGDASQINPIISKVAEASDGLIDLKLIYRDKDTDLIDAHLTDGRSRSIPMLLQLDSDFNLVGSYGPRPGEAQALVKGLLEKGEDYNIPLHTWYAKDKQKSLQKDIVKLLEKVS